MFSERENNFNVCVSPYPCIVVIIAILTHYLYIIIIHPSHLATHCKKKIVSLTEKTLSVQRFITPANSITLFFCQIESNVC